MKNNAVQFAVVREDPQIEMDLIERFSFERATLIGSGGCTAFCLKALKPDLEITLIEPNPNQIDLINRKIAVLGEKNEDELLEKFGVENNSSDSLTGCGNFESLFRGLRLFINEFIISETDLRQGFTGKSGVVWSEIFGHRYWRTAFDLFFSDSILSTMFGPAAIQHAPSGSYPGYFRGVFERGLLRADAGTNYFLHHVFLGHYLENKAALPYYLTHRPERLDFDIFAGPAQNYDGFRGVQLAHFSNIFDWCGEDEVKKIAELAAKGLAPGSVAVYRQLNNKNDFRPFFGNNFRWLESSSIVERDRSLFYEKLEIGEKII